MTDFGMDKLIAKLKKILALQSSPNENEAARAAAKAQTLLAAHNLSLHDVLDSPLPGENAVQRDWFITDDAEWVRPLLREVAALYFCGYFHEVFPAEWLQRMNLHEQNRRLLGGSHTKVYVRHSFVGEQHNVVVAQYMVDYLIKAVERACRRALEDSLSLPVFQYGDKKQRKAFRLSFLNACSARLCVRLAERRRQTSENGVQNGTNLPALRSLYEQAQDAFNKWAQEQGMEFEERADAFGLHCAEGAQAGAKAGEAIGLDQQLATNHTARITH